MNEFKKGDFVRLRDGRLGVVAGIYGNQIRVRLNDMSLYIAYTLLDKINGCFVPLDLSDARVRNNLRVLWLEVTNGGVYEIQVEQFRKPLGTDSWLAVFNIDGDTVLADACILFRNATIDGLTVAAVEEVPEDEEKKADA